jgi:hypothetical protein
MKVGLFELHALCVSVYPPTSLYMAEPIFRKLGMYIMAPQSIFMAYIINPFHQSVCVYMCIPLSLLGNDPARTSPRQRIHTQQYKNCWMRRFLCGPCIIKERRWLVFPRTSCSPIYTSIFQEICSLRFFVLKFGMSFPYQIHHWDLHEKKNVITNQIYLWKARPFGEGVKIFKSTQRHFEKKKITSIWNAWRISGITFAPVNP